MKLDRGSVVMGDDRPCSMEGIGTVHIKMTRNSMVVLKGVRHNNLYYLKGSRVTG